MSGHGNTKKSFGKRVVQLLALGLFLAMMMGVSRLFPEQTSGSSIAAVGFLLLAGVLASELLDTVGLPHLSGYLIAGIVAGPHVLHLVHHATVEHLSIVNTLAVALIALAGGAELRIDDLRRSFGSLLWATVMQCLIVSTVTGAVFVLLSSRLPFTASLSSAGVVGAGLLWGVLSVSRSPAACMGILSQTRAVGPVARFSLGFVMTSDFVVVLLLALTMMVARP
jgi:Kef-type K+ transport system membrane component KefB